MKQIKSKLYPIFVVTLILGLAGLGLGLFQVTIWLEPNTPESPSIPTTELPRSPEPPAASDPLPTLSTDSSPTSPFSEVSPTESPDLAAVAARQGSLRVSNPTEHPVRVALLPRGEDSSTTREPVHWDFAPKEGSTQGLILSLPEENLQLSQGDILVAFAQDGSRQYWGPYVVGETPAPIWDGQEAEWQLTLRP